MLSNYKSFCCQILGIEYCLLNNINFSYVLNGLLLVSYVVKEFVQDLVDQNERICGRPLSAHSDELRKVEAFLEESEDKKPKGDFRFC